MKTYIDEDDGQRARSSVVRSVDGAQSLATQEGSRLRRAGGRGAPAERLQRRVGAKAAEDAVRGQGGDAPGALAGSAHAAQEHALRRHHRAQE